MALCDTHCHLTFPDFRGEVEEVVARARAAGVLRLVNVGTSLEDSRRGVELAERFEAVSATVGIHPHEADRVKDLGETMAQLEQLASHPKVEAIGEIGLDFFRSPSAPKNQQTLFLAQLKLALKVGKPVVLHIRDAYREVIELLKAHYLPHTNLPAPALAHSFTSGPKNARQLLDLGLLLAFNGIITLPRSEEIQAALKMAPLNRIVLETDAPFLAPLNHRGRRNEPAFMTEVAAAVARIKGVSLGEIAENTLRTSLNFFSA